MLHSVVGVVVGVVHWLGKSVALKRDFDESAFFQLVVVLVV